MRFHPLPTRTIQQPRATSVGRMWRVLVVFTVFVFAGCAAQYSTGAVGDPLPPGAVSASAAESVARGYLEDKTAPVWASVSGPFDLVYDALLPQHLERPSFADEKYAKSPVWGVQFKVVVDICPPSPWECTKRDGLRTVFVDAMTGEWLRTSTFAPNEGVPLPKPRGLTSWIPFWI